MTLFQFFFGVSTSLFISALICQKLYDRRDILSLEAEKNMEKKVTEIKYQMVNKT